MTAINSRIVRVGIQIDNDFELFEGLDIRCLGQKFASPESNQCLIKISNLTRTQKNFILTAASPMTISQNPNRKPILVTLDVGRSNVFPPFRLYQGYCWASSVTMPPDIGIVLESTTNNLQAATMQPVTFGAMADLRTISQGIASLYGLSLNFTASPKQIANFNYTGGMQHAINKLALCGNIRVQLDNNTLSVYDAGKTAGTLQSFTLNTSTGMVSIPEVTESGVKAMMLVRPEPQIGGPITIQSAVNPAVNGNYYISTINYNIASRDDPFWYEIFCSNLSYIQGVL